MSISLAPSRRKAGKKRKNRTRRRRQRGGRSGGSRGLFGNIPDAPYLLSLADPDNHMARIPDTNCWPSATWRETQDFALTTASDGAVSAVIGPCPIAPGAADYYAGIVSSAIEATATKGVWATTAFTVPPTSSATVIALFSEVRVVSGCMCVEYIGNTNTDAGEICAYPIFRGQKAATTMANATHRIGALCLPLRNGVRMNYKPMDSADLEYHPLGIVGGSAATTSMYGFNDVSLINIPIWDSPISEKQPVAFGVFIVGATASTKVARVRIAYNFEGISIDPGLTLFPVKAEMPNPDVVSAAFGMAAQLPWADAWQGVAGTLGKIGTELSQRAFDGAVSAGTAYVAGRLRKFGSPYQRLGYTSDFAGDSLGLD